ncbi:hypothetical protein AgCh_005826 [Apium graveolens]
MIYDGPHRTIKLAVAVAGQEEKMVDKPKDYNAEDLSSIMKDAKEYEHFDSRDNESLTEIYDRFQKLLNDLSLVNKEYDQDDSNLKFLLALPKKWDFKVTSIRDNYELEEISLDKIYGMLKTHELEMEQRSKRKGSKSRPFAPKVEEKPKEKARRKDTDSELDTDGDHDNNEDIEQMADILVKSFKKMVNKKFKKGKRFSRKGSSSSNSDKRNDRRNIDWKESKTGKFDKIKEMCYNCDVIGHFAADCRKPKIDKKQALITKKKHWDDSSNSDDGVNYALMENAETEAGMVELKVPQTTLAFDTDNICELRLFLKSLHVSYKDQTLENNIIKSENSKLKKMNDHLEIVLLSMLEIQNERDNVVYVKERLLEKHAYLEKELVKERKKNENETKKVKPTNTDNKVILNKVILNKVQLKPIKFNSSVDAVKSVFEVGSTSALKSSLNTDKSDHVNTKSVNIGLMTQKELKQKLKDLHMKDKEKRPRKNMNGLGLERALDWNGIDLTGFLAVFFLLFEVVGIGIFILGIVKLSQFIGSSLGMIGSP